MMTEVTVMVMATALGPVTTMILFMVIMMAMIVAMMIVVMVSGDRDSGDCGNDGSN